MLTLPQSFLDYISRSGIKLSAVIGIVTSSLTDEQSSLADWDAGGQQGTPGTDFPETTFGANLGAGVVTATVVTTSEFTVGSAANEGYLIFDDGVNTEIVSYSGSTATQFTGLARGLYGTTDQAWTIGEDVWQLVISHGEKPDYDLEIQPKNWTQPTEGGAGPPVARMGARMVYRPVDSCYYLFGGIDNGAAYLQDSWKFDPANDQWTQLGPAADPPVRAYHVMIYNADADEIWLHGGTSGAGGAGDYLVDVWKYSFVTSNWTTNGAWDSGAGKYNHMACYWPGDGSNDPQMIVTGGRIHPGMLTRQTRWFDGSSWTAKTNAQKLWNKGDSCFMTTNGVMLTVGIIAGGFYAATYDPGNDTWKSNDITDPPGTRAFCTLVYDDVNNTALIFGGEPIGLDTGKKKLDSYNYSTNEWTALDEFNREGRTRHVAAWNSDDKEMCVWGGAVDSAAITWPTYLSPMRFKYYWASVEFRTQVMDLGSVPTVNGEMVLEDTYDTVNGVTGLAYDADYSDDGAAFTNLGDSNDGDEITELHRYWRFDVTLTNAGLSTTPAVQKIDANFDEIDWACLADRPVNDYPPVVKSIGPISSTVDRLKTNSKSSLGKIEFVEASLWPQKLITEAYPRNNPVYIKFGVIDDDFAITDYQLAFKGRIKDWSYKNGVISFDIDDFLMDMKKEIPEEDSGTGVPAALIYDDGGITSNPVEILKDILQNQINVPDRDIDLDSFDAVKDDATISGWKFDRTISSPEDAWKLAQEICFLIGAVMIPMENGKLGLKLFDETDAEVMTWDELTQNFRGEAFKGNAQSIRNFISTWYEWDGDGDEWSDFAGAEVATNADSVTNWGTKVLRTKSKWLGAAGAPYNGDTRASDVSARILAFAKYGVPVIELETNLSAYPVQIGDLVRIRSHIVRSNDQYKAWQRKQGIERPGRDITIIHNCEEENLVQQNAALAEVLNPVDYFQGSNSLDLGKDGSSTQAAYRYPSGYFPSSYNLTGQSFSMRLSVQDKTELANATAIQIFLYSPDTSNYYHKIYARADLTDSVADGNPWNKLGGAVPDGWTAVGSPDITSFRYLWWRFFSPLAADTIASGNLKLDYVILERTNRAFVVDHGRYSIPYLGYGCNESIDHKWWVVKKSINLDRGTIKWTLHRAREIALTQQFTSQSDFYNGTGEQVDLETTPGSVQIADNGGNFYASGEYEITMDMDQVPEQDGSWILSTTAPAETAVVFQGWASETGIFDGEETWLGYLEDADTIDIKARFYKIKARLVADTALANSPTVTEITATFANG